MAPLSRRGTLSIIAQPGARGDRATSGPRFRDARPEGVDRARGDHRRHRLATPVCLHRVRRPGRVRSKRAA